MRGTQAAAGSASAAASLNGANDSRSNGIRSRSSGTPSTSGSNVNVPSASAATATGGLPMSTPTPTGSSSIANASSRSRKRLMQLEAKLQQHMDCEDRRVKELTESILYDFLPAALNVMLPMCEDPLQELDADRCRAVAAAALAVSALSNAPPGFLEFLLCIPWRKLPQLYPRSDSVDKLLSHLDVSDEERRRLVNTRIEPCLVPVLLDFIYREEHAHSVPPMLQLAPMEGGEQQATAARQQQEQEAAAAAVALATAAAPDAGPLSAEDQEALAQARAVLDAVVIAHEGREPQFRNAPTPVVAPAAPSAVPAAPPAAGCCNCSAGVTLEAVAAVLDGATPLHCAALRGNPAQVDHLLFCGSDPGLRTAAGELAIELVPVCGDKPAGASSRCCRCMGPSDQEVWECRSKLARSLIARRCIFTYSSTLAAWLRLALLCVMCCLGLWGVHCSVLRPAVEAHVTARREKRRQEELARVKGLMERLRGEARSGQQHLTTAKQEWRCHSHKGPPDGGLQDDITMSSSSSSTGSGSGTAQQPAPQASKPPETQPPVPARDPQQAATLGQPQGSTVQKQDPEQQQAQQAQDPRAAITAADSPSEEQPGEQAFKCFVRAVHALQSLDLQGGTLASGLAQGTGCAAAAGSSPADLAAELADLRVLEDEQADLYCCWAQSVLLRFRACSCPGCSALAGQAIRMAHLQATRLYNKVVGAAAEAQQAEHMKKYAQDQAAGQQQEGGQQLDGVDAAVAQPAAPVMTVAEHLQRKQAVGAALARVVHAHVCLMADTEARQSPTRASVWRAEQCLREWDKLEHAGLAAGAAGLGEHQVPLLRRWARTADSDLSLAEALHGSPLHPSQRLQDVLAAAVTYHPSTGRPLLARPITQEVSDSLQQALALAISPSPGLRRLVESVAEAAAQELSSAAMLRELMGPKAVLTTSEGVKQLSSAIDAAAPFLSLTTEVEAARTVLASCLKRVMAAERLEATIDTVRRQVAALTAADCEQLQEAAAEAAAEAASGKQAPSSKQQINGTSNGSATPGSSGPSTPTAAAASSSKWDALSRQLDSAVEEARDANVGVSKAKRLLKELQAAAQAVEACRQLDATLSKRPCGSAALRGALAKAEAAAAAMSGIPESGALAEAFLARIQSGRKRLEVERAGEALHKALHNHRTVAELPKLEAAILNARKVGAGDIDEQLYRNASDLRAKLTDASKARQGLDAALRTLQRQQRSEDAEAVERSIIEARRWQELLAPDVARAAEALEAWRLLTASEAKLGKALRDGAGTGALARAVQEAAAAGVKVTNARRVLKLMQLLEAAMAAASSETVTDSATTHQLRAKIDAAEQGGVAPALLESARRLLRRLVVLDAKQSLEAALKPHSDWSVNQRIAVLKTALEAAEDVLGLSISEMAVAQQQQEQEQQPRQQMDEQQVQDQEQRGAEAQGAAGGKAEQQEGQHEKAEAQQVRAGAEQAGAGEAGADAAKASKDSSGAQEKADSGDAKAADSASGQAVPEPEQEQQASSAPGTPTAASGDANGAADAAGEPQAAAMEPAVHAEAQTAEAADAATPAPEAAAAGEAEATAQRPSTSGSASSEASAAPSAAAEEAPAASAPAATAAAPGRITLESQPSLTSSVAAQSDAGSSAAGMSHAWSQGSVGGAADGDVEDSALVLELGLRAWRLLEADQAELAAIEKERQEAERVRREQQARERQQRLAADQDRAAKEKAERAERERQSMDKQAKGSARKAAIKLKLEPMPLRKASSDPAATAAAADISARQQRQLERQQRQKELRERQQQQREQQRQQEQASKAQASPAAAAPAPAATTSPGVPPPSAGITNSFGMPSPTIQLPSPFGNRPSLATSPHLASPHDLQPPLFSLQQQSQQQLLTAQQVQAAVQRHLPALAQHGRTSSLDILGEAVQKLPQDMLDMLEDPFKGQTQQTQQAQQQKQQAKAQQDQQQAPAPQLGQLFSPAPTLQPPPVRATVSAMYNSASSIEELLAAGAATGQHQPSSPWQASESISRATGLLFSSSSASRHSPVPAPADMWDSGSSGALPAQPDRSTSPSDNSSASQPLPLPSMAGHPPGLTSKYTRVDLGGASWGLDGGAGGSAALGGKALGDGSGLWSYSVAPFSSTTGSTSGAAAGSGAPSGGQELRHQLSGFGGLGSVAPFQPGAADRLSTSHLPSINTGAGQGQQAQPQGSLLSGAGGLGSIWAPTQAGSSLDGTPGSAGAELSPSAASGQVDLAAAARRINVAAGGRQQLLGSGTGSSLFASGGWATPPANRSSDGALTAQPPLVGNTTSLVDIAAAAMMQGQGQGQQQGPQAQRSSRPCKHQLQGFCRDGDRCRFLHVSGSALPSAGAGITVATVPGSSFMARGSQLGQQGGSSSSAAAGGSGLGSIGGFAFGAPGSNAFSRDGLLGDVFGSSNGMGGMAGRQQVSGDGSGAPGSGRSTPAIDVALGCGSGGGGSRHPVLPDELTFSPPSTSRHSFSGAAAGASGSGWLGGGGGGQGTSRRQSST